MARPRIIATYRSRCPWCDMPILEGDTIALDEPNGEWCHEECAEDATPDWPEDDDA